MGGRIVQRLAFLALCAAVSAHAQQAYIVAKGDNLWSIARRYGLTVTELKSLNHLSSTVLQPGQRLIVSRTVTEETKKTENAVTLRTVKTYHTVTPGETLASLAKKYETTVEELKRQNNLKSSRVQVGQRLLVKTTTHRQEVPQELPKPPKTTAVAAAPAKKQPTAMTRQRQEVEAILKNNVDLVRILSSEDSTGRVLSTALSFLGTPYRLGGNSYRGIDCSGLVKKSYDTIGLDLPRTSRSQFEVGTPVTLSELVPGDLVFFTRRGSQTRIGHVGIYVGDGYILHASSNEHKVVLQKLDECDYLMQRYAGARRVLTLNPAEDNVLTQ